MPRSHISRALAVHACGLSSLLLSSTYDRLSTLLPASLYHQFLILAGCVLLIGALTLALARNSWVENWSRHLAPWPPGIGWESLMFLTWILPINGLIEYSIHIIPYHSRDDITLRLFVQIPVLLGLVWASGWLLKAASLSTTRLCPKLLSIKDSFVQLEPGLPFWLPLLPAVIGSVILWLMILQDFSFPPAFLIPAVFLALIPILALNWQRKAGRFSLDASEFYFLLLSQIPLIGLQLAVALIHSLWTSTVIGLALLSPLLPLILLRPFQLFRRLWQSRPRLARRWIAAGLVLILVLGSIDEDAPVPPENLRLPESLPWSDAGNGAPILQERLEKLQNMALFKFSYYSNENKPDHPLWRKFLKESAQWQQLESALDQALTAPIFCSLKDKHALQTDFNHDHKPYLAAPLIHGLERYLNHAASEALYHRDYERSLTCYELRHKVDTLLTRDIAAPYGTWRQFSLPNAHLIAELDAGQLVRLERVVLSLPEAQELLAVQQRMILVNFDHALEGVHQGSLAYLGTCCCPPGKPEKIFASLFANPWSFHPQASRRQLLEAFALQQTLWPQELPRQLAPDCLSKNTCTSLMSSTRTLNNLILMGFWPRRNQAGKLLATQCRNSGYDHLVRAIRHQRAQLLLIAQKRQQLATGKLPLHIEELESRFRPKHLQDPHGKPITLDPKLPGSVLIEDYSVQSYPGDKKILKNTQIKYAEIQ
ncbi:MAG: hypothetical protein RL095_3557 [Verrucomicrobiota bacterium]|jgi:hypothetical protein